MTISSSVAPENSPEAILRQQLQADRDPPIFETANPQGAAPILLLADHAGRAVPTNLNRLGLGDAPFERHIAYDIGVETMTRSLAKRLDAPALIYNYSRLLLDPNRSLDDPTSICAISDGVIVPANRHLTAAEAAKRASDFFHPYHQAIEDRLDRFDADGVRPTVISVHSFTHHFKGYSRPWHVGILWGDDGDISLPLIDRLRREPDLCIGDNQPYTGKNRHGYSIETHAYGRDLPNTLIEVRQDLIDTPEKAVHWAGRLAECLEPFLPHVGQGGSGHFSNQKKAATA